MTPRRDASRSGRGPLVLVLGESRNDVDSLATLIRGTGTGLSVEARLRPPSLTRDAGTAAIRTWTTTLEALVRAERAVGRDIRAVVVHRDADGPDAKGAQERTLDDQLAPVRSGGAVTTVAAVPVETIEAWWFLFPDAVESVNPVAWKGVMPRANRDVETIARPKAELMRHTRRGRGRREYSEADSPAIARNIVELGIAPLGRSASYARFCKAIGGLDPVLPQR